MLTRVLMGLQAGRNTLLAPSPPPTAGCPTSRSFFARCGIPQLSPRTSP